MDRKISQKKVRKREKKVEEKAPSREKRTVGWGPKRDQGKFVGQKRGIFLGGGSGGKIKNRKGGGVVGVRKKSHR